ncbi:MAG TPA: hypothetical protein VN667_08990 [Burkholderiales bacterium]|nr:hypothetical protein [Burkholderiales bacterium]
MKPRYHLIGLAIVLVLIWRVHSLLNPLDSDADAQTNVPTLAVSEAQPEERPQALPDPESANDSSADAPAATALAATATFMGKPCPDNDCSVDLAGYHWAEEHGINDPGACPDPSGAFVAGCRLYAGIEQKYNI